MKHLTLILLLAATGCEGPMQTAERERAAGDVLSETRFGDGVLLTIEHDAHWFVLECHVTSRTALLHHPGCPCLRLPAGGFVPLEP